MTRISQGLSAKQLIVGSIFFSARIGNSPLSTKIVEVIQIEKWNKVSMYNYVISTTI